MGLGAKMIKQPQVRCSSWHVPLKVQNIGDLFLSYMMALGRSRGLNTQQDFLEVWLKPLLSQFPLG